ncbi:threonine ammonia-lyase [Geobacter sp. SVR]|uniref:threonine ammonia-lyase n=1 Tax=Geobacter sp. SVR TaxID=2495594 RepID=UPI00143EFC12|nr:threonine ammonia-lyase [Geobacter sp. SVR]BCS55999.1 L-threonine ammonia-lyase [Geobacter sp. SVR]GCF84762.1 L-threonine ammonia-lyase [Geobacter sp. SVR]
MQLYELILEAHERLKKRIRRTELIHSHYYSEKLGAPLLFKCENLQRTGSFKIRGALNFMTAQSREALKHGVITASAGNHAQGVAFSADLLGVKASIYMPEITPPQKVQSTRDYGAEVVLTGRNFDEACQAALQAQHSTGALFVHPFDDPLVMAGQGTIALEILEDLPDLKNLIVPVGGGGLIAGIAAAVRVIAPHVRIIGVESMAAPSMSASFKAGKPCETPVSVTLADGIAVKRPGALTVPVIRGSVDEIVLVEEEEIAQAIVSLLEKTKLLVEGAGAVPLAAVLHDRIQGLSGKTVCLLSGGNIDVKTIALVVERGLLAAGRYLKLSIELDDLPGALATLSADIAATRANIFLINHDRRSKSLPLGRTDVSLELETRGYEHIREIVQELERKGYSLKVE